VSEPTTSDPLAALVLEVLDDQQATAPAGLLLVSQEVARHVRHALRGRGCLVCIPGGYTCPDCARAAS